MVDTADIVRPLPAGTKEVVEFQQLPLSLLEMVDTADIVRPLPAGTKEVVEIQPSVSIKDARSMFERGSSGDLKNVDFRKQRSKSLKSSWISSNDSGTGT